MLTGAVSKPDVVRTFVEDKNYMIKSPFHIIALYKMNNKSEPIKNILGRGSLPKMVA